jgi:beta-N-acetylhexosaminidase
VTSRRRRPLSVLGVATVAAGLTAMAACDSSTPTAAPSRPVGTPATSGATSSATGTPSTHPTTSATTTAATTEPRSCGERLAQAMTPAQRAGQLLMVGLQPTGSSRALAAQVRAQGLGGVILLGGWHGGRGSISPVTARLQAAAGGDLLIAADQEGGQVQQLRGAGFTRIPSARIQAESAVAAEEDDVRTWSRQLAKAGINVNLAPVADTVPTSLGAANAPIGRFGRDFVPGDAAANARYAAAFVRGSLAAGVAPTVKHFPGLGRVTGNTDLTSSGITDRTASTDDPYLEPFEAGIEAGAPLVMVSSARYPELDAKNQAVFSKAVVTDLLRKRLGYDGVVITDDVGAARAVAAVTIGDRATRFVAAGGDIVLTADARQARTMLSAIAQRRKASSAFAGQVDAAAARVLDLKAGLGLVRCG